MPSAARNADRLLRRCLPLANPALRYAALAWLLFSLSAVAWARFGREAQTGRALLANAHLLELQEEVEQTAFSVSDSQFRNLAEAADRAREGAFPTLAAAKRAAADLAASLRDKGWSPRVESSAEADLPSAALGALEVAFAFESDPRQRRPDSGGEDLLALLDQIEAKPAALAIECLEIDAETGRLRKLALALRAAYRKEPARQ